MLIEALVALSTALPVQEGADIEVAGAVPFLRSYDQAFAVAKSTGKPVIAYFTYHG